MLPNLNEIANLVYNTSGRNVDTTIVKRKYTNGKQRDKAYRC